MPQVFYASPFPAGGFSPVACNERGGKFENKVPDPGIVEGSLSLAPGVVRGFGDVRFSVGSHGAGTRYSRYGCPLQHAKSQVLFM